MGARDKRPRLNRGSCWTEETCRGYNLVITTPISEGKAKSGGRVTTYHSWMIGTTYKMEVKACLPDGALFKFSV